MDLLGDIGTQDQLIATRSENDVLKQTVTKLTQQVQDLTLQLTVAKAEIDLYRNSRIGAGSDDLITTTRDGSGGLTTTFSNMNVASNCGALIGIDNNINNSINYCHIPKHILSNLHDNSNPVCISMFIANDDNDDSMITIVTGGADSTLRWTRYSTSNQCKLNIGGGDSVEEKEDASTTTIVYDQLTAPVVCTATLSQEIKRYGNLVMHNTNIFDSYVVVGTMDGHITLLNYYCCCDDADKVDENKHRNQQPQKVVKMVDSSSSQSTEERITVLKKHDKYVSSISWILVDDDTIPQQKDSSTSWLATSSADGTIHIYTVTASTTDNGSRPVASQVVKVQHIESFYFDNPVTSICYAKGLTNNGMIVLYVYVRNTPHIKVIHMPSSIPTTETSGNCCNISTVLHLNTSIYDTHVSFAVLDIKMSHDYKYIAVACDNHCHLIVENNCTLDVHQTGTVRNTTTNNNNTPSIQKANIIRKLYGHVADSYSRPIVAWSCNNQYVYCNTQNDTKLCIYSIASGKLLEDHDNSDHRDRGSEQQQQQLSQPHVRPIKYLCSHPYQNILVTTSFDRKTIVWTPQERKEALL
jgi:hypothetical protein